MNIIEVTNALVGKEENLPIFLNTNKIESFGPIISEDKNKSLYPGAKSYICISSDTDIEYKVKETPEEIQRKIRNNQIDMINTFATKLAIKLKRD